MTTQYEVTGFDRPAALYEFASAHGIHAGSIEKLVSFALEIQRRALAHTTTKEEKAVTTVVVSQVSIDPAISELVDANFWDLLTNAEKAK